MKLVHNRYQQLASPLVKEGIWADTDDYLLMEAWVSIVYILNTILLLNVTYHLLDVWAMIIIWPEIAYEI
jgi:hypothetical protein